MSGQPKTRALIAEINARAADESCSAFEYVERWLESGHSLVGLAQDIADCTDLPVMRATLTRYLDVFAKEAGIPPDEAEQRLTRARSIGAIAKVEQAEQIADAATVDDVQVARLKVHARHWSAERFNREQFGQKTGVSVSVTVGSLHLDALRAAPIRMGEIVTGSVIEGGGITNNTALLSPVSVVTD